METKPLSETCPFTDDCAFCPVFTHLQAYACSAWIAQSYDDNSLNNSSKNPDHLDVINLVDYMSIEDQFCQWHNTAYPDDLRFRSPNLTGVVLPFINTR